MRSPGAGEVSLLAGRGWRCGPGRGMRPTGLSGGSVHTLVAGSQSPAVGKQSNEIACISHSKHFGLRNTEIHQNKILCPIFVFGAQISEQSTRL